MKLSEMRHILSEEAIQLSKSLGQNFLHDANQLHRIVAAAELNKSDLVLEIGPGLGPLTEALLQHAGPVLAIEKDARLVAVLRKRFDPWLGNKFGVPPPGGSPTMPEGRAPAPGPLTSSEVSTPPLETAPGPAPALELVQADALEYLRRVHRDWSAWKLVANLPYSVASPILVDLAWAERPPARMVATLQLEVARRLMAGPGSPDYGVLTLLVQLAYAPGPWFKIPASCFFPEPEVDSACVCLIRRAQPLLLPAEATLFSKIVKRSFSQRRKMMLKLLKQDWPAPALQEAFARLQLSPQLRAEAISLEQFVDLTKTLLLLKSAKV